MRTNHFRKGFTLIELLIVVVIIGILAAIAIPKFSATKGKAQVSTMKSDLHNLASAEEDYYYNNSQYAGNVAQVNFQPSRGVVLTIVESGPLGWSAQTTHPQAVGITCAVYYGGATTLAPANAEGTITCQ